MRPQKNPIARGALGAEPELKCRRISIPHPLVDVVLILYETAARAVGRIYLFSAAIGFRPYFKTEPPRARRIKHLRYCRRG